MLKNKTVAVVVPAYNEEIQIAKVISEMPDFVDKIIIINDFSTDKTEEVVKSFIEKGRTNGDNKKNGYTDKKNGLEVDRNSEIEVKRSRFYDFSDRVEQKMLKNEEKLYTPYEIVNDNFCKDRITLINHKVNAGVGAAIATGYRLCRDYSIDCSAVMAGDAQMDPAELESICIPVVTGNADYVKGNRLIHRAAWLVIPKIRYIGNSVLSLLTKIASGYWHVSDTQTGYTAISLEALHGIRIHNIYKGYGMPNDMLVKLNIASFTVKEVPIKPVYHVGQVSKMKIFKVIPTISLLLIKCFIQRLYVKYLFKDFHPLFLFYHTAVFFVLADIPVIYELVHSYMVYNKPQTLPYWMMFIFFSTTALQMIFFAMWMDMQDNERLQRFIG